MDPRMLERRSFDAAALARDHPPRFSDPSKRAVHAALAGGAPPRGVLELTRWTSCALPGRRRPRRPDLLALPGFLEYGQRAPPGTLHWHMNFAMTDCFGAYGGPLLAQDELQVLEHPVLASLREASRALGFPLRCAEAGRPTPLLVAGAERRGVLDTAPSPRRPGGLYGNAFARAPSQEVLAALERLDPPQISNVVAIEAPAHGRGRYRPDELEGILATACSGFRAVVVATRDVAARVGACPRTVLHTGFWGAGDSGGDPELMALLQLLAAELAELDEVVFYTARAGGEELLDQALRRYAALPAGATVADALRRVHALGYAWGVGNGT